MLGTLWCEELTLRVNERAGQPASQADLVDVAKLVTVLLRVASGSGGPRAEGQLRHVGTPRLGAAFLVQRGSHRRHLPGHLRLPGAGGHHRAAVPRPGHPWSVRARVRDRAGGPRGQRGHRAGGQPGRVHADARAVPGHPRLQRRPRRRPGRRDRDHPVPQPAGGRRVQVQPARRRPGRARRSPRSSRTGPTSCWPAGCARCAGSATRRPGRASTTATFDFLGEYVGQLPAVVDLDIIRGGRHPDRRRPAGRRQRRLLGARSPSGTGST